MGETKRGVRKLVLGALGFVGATAVAGGVEMVAFPEGNMFVKEEWLEHLPGIDDYVVPGLALGLGIGGGSLVTAFGVWRKPAWAGARAIEAATGHHWALAATAIVGAALGAWIAVEVALIPERSPIELLYGGLAVALVAACFTPSFRAGLRN